MNRRIGIVVAAGLCGALCIGAAVYAADRYLARQAHTPDITTVHCDATHAAHTVFIHNGEALPANTSATLCDTLTITNDDDRLRLMAFGAHDHHDPYDGVTEKVLSRGQSLTVTLDQTGTYEFHDHLQETVLGYFTVR